MVKKIVSLKKLFQNCDSVYLDTNVLVYFFQDDERYSTIIEEIFDILEAEMTDVYFSSILLTELLVYPFKKGRAETAASWLNYFKIKKNIHIVNLDPKIAVDASFLRAKYDIKAPDSIHMATAMQRKNGLFLTNDNDLKKVQEVKVICIEDFL